MRYNLIITERAEQLLDNTICYILYKLNNRQAAKHLLDNVERIYKRLQENPFQFPECRDKYLSYKGYREAVFPDMRYIIIYRVENNNVFVLGIFHQSEQYDKKL